MPSPVKPYFDGLQVQQLQIIYLEFDLTSWRKVILVDWSTKNGIQGKKGVKIFLSSCFSKKDANMIFFWNNLQHRTTGNESYSKFCFLLSCFDNFLDSPIERFFFNLKNFSFLGFIRFPCKKNHKKLLYREGLKKIINICQQINLT